MRRFLVLIAAVATLVAGCGNKVAEHKEASTEGIYLTLAHLTYQVQISRILNPALVEDRAYLSGVAATAPTPQETWFGVFLRVANPGNRQLTSTGDFTIQDTQGHVFQPVHIDPKVNAFAYTPTTIAPHQLVPPLDAASADGPIQGAEVLFKLPYTSYQNRPLQLKIIPPGGTDVGIVDLDL